MPPTSPAASPPFLTTHWSVVIAAQGGDSRAAQSALEILCRAYWYPLYAYVRRCGQSPHNAQDLTQEFFCRLLEKRWLDAADREKGRLRTFLIVALKHFMAKEWRHASAQRRGGAHLHVPLDTALAEDRYASETCSSLTADRLFDRQWALTLLDLTLERLQAEFARLGKAGDFEALKTCLMAERGALDYAAVAARLGSSEGAARVAVHRLRKRFREIYREELAQTLADETELDGELRHLAAALAEP
jgi:RNA polymerase sigma factor (sigma-70 family)